MSRRKKWALYLAIQVLLYLAVPALFNLFDRFADALLVFPALIFSGLALAAVGIARPWNGVTALLIALLKFAAVVVGLLFVWIAILMIFDHIFRRPTSVFDVLLPPSLAIFSAGCMASMRLGPFRILPVEIRS